MQVVSNHRGTIRWAIVAVAALTIVACGVEEQSSSSAPKRSASDLATMRAGSSAPLPTATPRRLLPTAAASPTRIAVVEPTATPEPPPPGVDDDPSLLAVEDLPTIWTASADTEDGGIYLCGAPSIEETFEVRGFADTTFSATNGQYFYQWITRLNDTDAQAAMDHAREAFSCETDTTEADGGHTRNWTFNSPAFPALGDETFALHMTITHSNPVYTPNEAYLSIVRSGPFLVSIFHVGFTLDPADTVALAERAVEKLRLVGPPGPATN